MSPRRPVYIDNCVVDRFAESDIDPVAQLVNSEFMIAVTPDLAGEYQQALAHPRVGPKSKQLLRNLLDDSRELGIFGFGGSPYSGFGHGFFASPAVAATISSIQISSRNGKPIPKNRTDAFLIALSEGEIVVTNDERRPWKGRKLHGVVQWSEVQDAISRGDMFLDLLRTKFLNLST